MASEDPRTSPAPGGPASGPGTPIAVPPAETPELKTLVGLVIGVVVVAALYLARDVLVPIMLAVLLSFLLTPLANLLRRLHLGRVPAVLVAVGVALGIIVGLGTIMGTQVASLASNVPSYVTSIQAKAEKLSDSTVGRLPRVLGRLEDQIRGAVGPNAQAPAPQAVGRNTVKPIPVEVHEPAASPLATAAAVLAPIVGPIETTVIVLVVAIFFLLQREDLRDRLIRLFGSTDLHKTTVAMDDAAARLSRYFITQLSLNSAFGIVIGIGLWLVGVPSAPLWGVLAALMRFIPYVGSFLAAAPPLILAAAVDPGWTMVLLVAALFTVGESMMGYVVEPMVYGHSTGLTPVSVVVAAIFWTWLWGPIGLILSTPLTLCLVVLGRHVERLE
ncbi:MAG TPA: AI-2E family transporter, partial [Sphingomonadaceae bacterium]|nr:AI-2E family transporter [Sphingomonadaceae bacterium]